MDRRTFLKIAGVGGLSFAASCTSQPAKTLYSLVEADLDMVTGEPTWFASTCRECPAGCGVLAKNREGRVIKVEGNPLHPINQGRLCIRGQAALQSIYNPDRIKTPLLKDEGSWRRLTFTEAEAILASKASAAAKNGRDRVRMLTEVVGESLTKLTRESLKKWNSTGPLVFEPYAYESVKEANKKVFGQDVLVSYRMEEADFLVSFGADFLETWLSPVEYARKFKEMHSLKGMNKPLYFHVSPYQSLTGANADTWLSCIPDSEYAIALGLLRESLRRGRGKRLPEKVRLAIDRVSSPYTRDNVRQLSGLEHELFAKLADQLHRAENPLILGTSTGATGSNSLQTNIAVNLLNLALDPNLTLLDFANRHRVEEAARRSDVLKFFSQLESDSVDLLLLNNVNPAFALHAKSGVRESLERESLFVVSFSNFMDETTELADLILPVRLPLETWDEYSGKSGIVSTMQPTMGSLTRAPTLGDVLLRASFGPERPFKNFKAYLFAQLTLSGVIQEKISWLQALQGGGIFEPSSPGKLKPPLALSDKFEADFSAVEIPKEPELVLLAAPSIRFFDGRGANRSWLCEIPDPLTKVAWQTPVLVHPDTLAKRGLQQGDIVQIESRWGQLQAPIYRTEGVRVGVAVISIGQGHTAYGRYASGTGLNPIGLLPAEVDLNSGAPFFTAGSVALKKTGQAMKLAHTDGSRIQHGRKIALSVGLKELSGEPPHKAHGLGMWEFPFTLPLPEGYDPERDFYPPHEHKDYRWAMVVDLDRCIGCSACAAACYAENNVGVVGEERMVEGREMSWLAVQRYEDPTHPQKITFLPMLCQHCDNAPCESVCPVFAPHHSQEGLNNQIYNRCIGTRFCSQDCPYKVRRFNWFEWQWPESLNLQLNPEVTVRSKGVMEKCSFCIQRIKAAHNEAKNKGRKILDGEVQPACLQTCPTGVFTFGNLMDKESQVWEKFHDQRAYQVMGYLNAKPAVVYLKKVVQEI